MIDGLILVNEANSRRPTYQVYIFNNTTSFNDILGYVYKNNYHSYWYLQTDASQGVCHEEENTNVQVH